jgi:oligopeptide/dipeptide ABC transporter ATP-binding protein
MSMTETLIDVRDLHVHFALRGGTLGRLVGGGPGRSVRAVDGVSFELRRGEVLGLVGESGSGKTTLGRALLSLVPATSGAIEYDGRDLTRLSEHRMRPYRRRLQMVFQDPHASLNPSMNLLTAIGHPLQIHGICASAEERRDRVIDAMERVGLAPVEHFLHKYPSDLSGGQKQRAVLARAIILGPELLVADEPVSMLDMSVRAKILELMLALRDDLDLTYVYVTHDLATAKFFCDRIAIMYLGRIVEIGPTEQIFAEPRHPYTRALLAAIPDPDPAKGISRSIPRGEVPDAAQPPLGCAFHPRCPVAVEQCGWESRDLRSLLERRWAHLGEEAFERESPIIANLPGLEASDVAELQAGRGRGGTDIADLLRAARADQPDEPLWRGVGDIEVGDRSVTVRFAKGVDPRRRPAGDVEVACVHYGDDASRHDVAQDTTA